MADNIKYILFDCMETLVDMTEIPDLRVYAFWAFNGSGVEKLWSDFEEFFRHYQEAKRILAEKLPEFKEYELIERLEIATGLKLSQNTTEKAHDEEVQAVAHKLYQNFWKVYVSKSYLRDDVKPILNSLSEKYRLGVVSNFLVRGGIEELLEIHGISHYFDFIITSVNEGWRKPHLNIYQTAIRKVKCSPDEIVFIGDDFENDYIGPQKIGFKPILLDRQNKFHHIKEKVKDFYELERLI